MDQELKAKWVAALRSGEYKQGRFQLRHGDKYCCLGVLCVIQDRLFWECDAYPPHSLRAGISIGVMANLSGMNDNKGKSFNEIADWIEENL